MVIPPLSALNIEKVGSNSYLGTAYTFYVYAGCTAPLVVTSVTDGGTGTSCGTLSYALTQATNGQTINFALTTGNTITFTGSLAATVKVKAGVTIYRDGAYLFPAHVQRGQGYFSSHPELN